MQGLRIPDDIRYEVKELAAVGIPLKAISRHFNIAVGTACGITGQAGIRDIKKLPEDAVAYVLATHEKNKWRGARAEIQVESESEIVDFAGESIAIDDIAQHLKVHGWQVCAFIRGEIYRCRMHGPAADIALESIARFEQKQYDQIIAATKKATEKNAKKADKEIARELAAIQVETDDLEREREPMPAPPIDPDFAPLPPADLDTAIYDGKNLDAYFDCLLKDEEKCRGYSIVPPERKRGMDKIDYKQALSLARPKPTRKMVKFGSEWVEIEAAFGPSDEDYDLFIIIRMGPSDCSRGMSQHQAVEISHFVALKYMKGQPAALWQLVKNGTQLRDLP